MSFAHRSGCWRWPGSVHYLGLGVRVSWPIIFPCMPALRWKRRSGNLPLRCYSDPRRIFVVRGRVVVPHIALLCADSGLLSLRRFPAIAVVLVAMAATAGRHVLPYRFPCLGSHLNYPDNYLMNTWMPGLAFFALGFQFSQWQVRWPFWAAIPLPLAIVFIAPLNHGCTFSFRAACGSVRSASGCSWAAMAFCRCFSCPRWWFGCRRLLECGARETERFGASRLYGKEEP